MASTFPTTADSFSTSHADGVNEIISAATINDNSDAINKVERYVLAANKRVYNVESSTYGAVSDDYYTDGVSNATTTFTSATANFTGADVGKQIVIQNVEFPSAEHELNTTIASVTNSTTVVLTRTSSRTRSNLRFYISRGGDQTTPIQNAINDAAASGGGTVFLPGAGYLVSGLVLKHRVMLVGRGYRSTLLHLTNSTPKPVVMNDQTLDNYAQFCGIRDLTIDGNAFNQAAVTTTLSAGYTAGAGSVSIASATNWLYAGAFMIGTNRFIYSNRTGTTVSGVVGGVEDTTDANASSGATVTYYPHSGINFSTAPVATMGASDESFDPAHQISRVQVRNCFGTGIELYGMSETRVSDVTSVNHWEGGCRSTWDTHWHNVVVSNAGRWGFYSRQSEVRFTNCKAFNCGSFAPAEGAGFFVDGLSSLEEGCYQLDACVGQDNRAEGFKFRNAQRVIANIAASSNSIRGVGSNAGVKVSGCTNGSIRAVCTERMFDQVNSWQQNALEIQDTTITTQGMDIWVSHGLSYTATVGTAIKSGSTISSGNVIRVNSQGGSYVPAYTASYTPDPYLAEVHQMTLTGNLTINAPANAHLGCKLKFVLIQDATGGRTMTFNAAYPANWGPNLIGGSTNVIEFFYNGTAWIQTDPSADVPKTVEVRTDVSAGAVTTFADIPDLSFPVVAGQNYRFEALILYDTALATTGIRVAVNGPASPTRLAYETTTGLAATGSATNLWYNSAAAYDTGVVSTSSMNTTSGNIITMRGIIRPSANGTLTVRYASEVATSASVVIKAGSTLTWW